MRSQSPAAASNDRPGKAAPRRWITPIVVVVVAMLVRWPLLAEVGFPADQSLFAYWADRAADLGLSHVYDEYEREGRVRRWCNHPPIFVLLLTAAGMLSDATGEAPIGPDVVGALARGERTAATRHVATWLKLPGVLADLATGVLLAIVLGRRWGDVAAGALALLYVLHPAIIHDSAVWGQSDSIQTFFLVAGVVAGMRGRHVAMGAAAACALLTKAQSLILLPWFFLAIAARPVRDNLDHLMRRIHRALGGFAAATLIIVAPFGSRGVPGIIDAYGGAVGYYPYVHLNGFSAWFLVNPLTEPDLEHLRERYRRDDASGVLRITPRRIGLAALAAVVAVVCVTILRRRGRDDSWEWGVRVLPLAFFALPTQIHERYLYPAIALWMLTLTRDVCGWIGWLIVGAAAFLNAAWVYGGPADSMGEAFARALRASIAGQPVGVWCSIALLVVLAVSLSEPWWRPRAAAEDSLVIE